jgi:putative PIG3 family NAD(P)H quinone oxidoreductase
MAREFCTRPARTASIAAMKFLQVTEEQGRYLASLRETPTPVPARGEVLIRVTASGVNRADLSQIAGRYPPPPGESDILGLEVSGQRDDTGDAVCALLAGGGHAEYVAAPTGQVFPAPPGTDLVTAAGIPEASLTAFLNLVVEGGVARDSVVLIHAAASGVGLAAIQIAKLNGARVIGTTRSSEKVAAIEAAGADLVVDTSRTDVAAELGARWGRGGRGGRDAVDIVLDPIGSASLATDLEVLKVGGRIVILSTMSGSRAELDLALLMKKRARLVGSTLRSRSRAEKAAIVTRFCDEILPGFVAGRLTVTVDSVFPVERAAEAFQRMRENRNVGKIMIRWASA